MTRLRGGGLRVLVVEDEAMVSMLIEDPLEDLGCIVIGPMANAADALDIIGGGERVDATLLDIGLGGKSSLPVAGALADHGAPFARLRLVTVAMQGCRSYPSRSSEQHSRPWSDALVNVDDPQQAKEALHDSQSTSEQIRSV